MINKETPKLVDADFGKDPVSVSVMADFDRARSYVKNNYQTILLGHHSMLIVL